MGVFILVLFSVFFCYNLFCVVVLMKIKSNGINLYDTLFSGQCFRMEEESDGSFTLILSDRVINIKEEGDYLVLDSNVLNDLDLVVTKYLDLERDYEFINRKKSSTCRYF